MKKHRQHTAAQVLLLICLLLQSVSSLASDCQSDAAPMSAHSHSEMMQDGAMAHHHDMSMSSMSEPSDDFSIEPMQDCCTDSCQCVMAHSSVALLQDSPKQAHGRLYSSVRSSLVQHAPSGYPDSIHRPPILI